MRTDAAHGPSLWWYEMRTIFVVNERWRRLTQADTVAFLLGISRLDVVVDHAPDEAGTLGLARMHGLSVYDACYLDLARREGVALATLDRALIRAAQAERLALLGAAA